MWTCPDCGKSFPERLREMHLRLVHKQQVGTPINNPDTDIRVSSMTAKMQANVCGECGGDLRNNSDGHYHETAFPVKYVCCKCKGHVLEVKEEERDGIEV